MTNGTTEVVFDGDCAVCQAFANWLTRRDTRGRLTCYPSSACTWPTAADMPFATTLVTRTPGGRVDTASAAVVTALRALPAPWGLLGAWIAVLHRVPLLVRYHDWCYYAFAKRRVAVSGLLVRLHLLESSCVVPNEG